MLLGSLQPQHATVESCKCIFALVR
jgi:hypothetical protein